MILCDQLNMVSNNAEPERALLVFLAQDVFCDRNIPLYAGIICIVATSGVWDA